MTIIRHNYVSGALANQDLPRVGYTNLFRDGTVTVSSAAAGFPKENAYNGLTYDAWKTTGGATESIQTQVASQNADYMAVAVHTLSGSTVKPQRSTNGSAWTDLDTAYAVPDNRPIVWEWTSVADAYWRLLITSAPAAVSIGAIHVGLKTNLLNGLPVGWAMPALNEEIEHTNAVSEGGQILGRNIIRRGVKVEVSNAHVDYTWARADWDAFIQSALNYAVFFWWAKDGYAEALYGGLESASATFSTEKYVTPRFRLSGISR